jgi:hypothetical protein
MEAGKDNGRNAQAGHQKVGIVREDELPLNDSYLRPTASICGFKFKVPI